MQIVSRTVNRNEMLCDGTPRRENGYRAYVCVNTHKKINKYTGGPLNIYCKSPLLCGEDEAMEWVPNQEAVEG